MNKKYERSISTQRAESIKKRIPMIPPFVLDSVPIVPKIDLYPSDLIIDHLVLHHFPYNLISWPVFDFWLIFFIFEKCEFIFFANLIFPIFFLINLSNILKYPLKYP